MKNVWSIACKNSLVDQDTNSLSLLETLDELNIKYKDALNLKIVKTIPLSFHIVSLWFDEDLKQERKFQLLIEIIDSQNKKLKSFEQECVFPAGKKRFRVITKINGWGFRGGGVYKIKLKYKSTKKPYQLVSVIPIDLNLVRQKK